MKYYMPIKIAGIGRCLPKQEIDSSDIEKECDLPEGYCINELGIENRRWVTDETVTYMGAQAAEEAIKEAGIEASEIDLILNASTSFDRLVPDQAPSIQHQLGLEESGIPCTTLTAACIGFMAALDVSCSLIASGRYRCILIVNAEAISLITDKDTSVDAYASIGDGAAAAVVTMPEDDEMCAVHHLQLETYGQGISHMESSLGWFAVLNNLNSVESALKINREAFVSQGEKYLKELIEKARADLVEDSPSLIVTQQSTKGMLDYLGGIFEDKQIVNVMSQTGYCGSASLPMALYEAIRTEKLKRNDQFMLIGFGAGLTLGTAVLTY